MKDYLVQYLIVLAVAAMFGGAGGLTLALATPLAFWIASVMLMPLFMLVEKIDEKIS